MVKTSKKAGIDSNSSKKCLNPSRCCRYCGVSRPQSETTMVPKTPAQLSKWIQVLGPEFARNIRKFKSNWICLNHIRNRDKWHSRIPEKMENDPNIDVTLSKAKKVQTCKTNIRVCRLCEVSNLRQKMTQIPKDPDTVKKWIEILGPIFEKNIKNFKDNRICLKHIKNQEKGRGRLPKRMDNIPTLTSDDEDEKKVERTKTPKKKKVINGRKTKRIRKRTLNDITSSEDEMEDKDKEDFMDDLDFSRASDEMNPETVRDHNEEISNEQNQQIEKENYDCVVIDSPKINNTSNHLAARSVKLQNEENLGEKLPSNKSTNLKCKVLGIEDDESIFEALKSAEKCNENNEKQDDDADCVVIYQKTNYNTKPLVVEELPIEYFQCRVCDVYCHINKMIETPTNYDKMLKWLSILGDGYVENIVHSSPPHFVCKSHLRINQTGLGVTEKV